MPRGRPVRDAVQKAVQDVASRKKRKRDASKEFSIDYHTFTHLCDQILVKDIQAVDGKLTSDRGHGSGRRLFSCDLDKELASWIFTAANIYFGLSLEKVRQLAYQFAVKHEQAVPSSWKKEDWFTAFLKQHPSLHVRTSVEAPSRTNDLNQKNVQTFFRNLEDLVKRHCFAAEGMWYMDETGVTISDKPHKVGMKRDFQDVAAITSAKHSCPVTVTCSISAAGTTIPPYFVFPRRKFTQDLLTAAPVGSSGGAHSSGWLREEQFLDFLQHFVRHLNPSPQRLCLLLTDNRESYLSIDALHFARENGIVWLTYPPDCSHLLGPMESSVYGLIKTHINAAIEGWELASPRKTITTSDITAIITRVLPLAITSHNIMAGFKACGVFPLNPDIFTDSSVTECLISSDTHPYSEPVSIHNGGGCIHDARNLSDAAVACDVQVNTSNTSNDLQACHHSQDLSASSHTPTTGSSVTESGQTTRHLISHEPSEDDPELLATQCGQAPYGLHDSSEPSDEHAGFCKVCQEAFTHSSLEAVCLQCVLHRKWGEDDDMDLSLVTPPDTEPHSDCKPIYHTDGTTQDIHKDIHDLKNHTVSDSSPTHNIQNHTVSDLLPTHNIQNHSLPVAVDHFSIAFVIQPQNVLEPAHSTEVASGHDIHKDTRDLQDHSHTDSSPNHDINDHLSATDPTQDIDNSPTHCVSTMTNETANHPHNTAVFNSSVENHTIDLASTPNIEDRPHIDSIPICATVQDSTHEVEQPHSAPHVSESSRHSLTPELSTTQCGHTPRHLPDSPEPSDKHEVFCKLCQEPFIPSSLEAVCLQCMLHRKWGDDDDMDLSLVTPPDAEPHSDYKPIHQTEEAMEDIHTHTHIIEDHTHNTTASTHSSEDQTKSSTISAHHMENHTLIDFETTQGVYGHTDTDGLSTGGGRDHTRGTRQEEQLHSAPCASECPLSPAPGPSTAPGHINSPESSDEDDGVCQVCQEPFSHSNSEVVCLQCVLHGKWVQNRSYI